MDATAMGTVDDDSNDAWMLEQVESLFTADEMAPAEHQGMSYKLLWRPDRHWPTEICVAVVFREGDVITMDHLNDADVDALGLTPEQRSDLTSRISIHLTIGSSPGLNETTHEITSGDSVEEILQSLWEDGPYRPKAKGRAENNTDPAQTETKPVQRALIRMTVGASDGSAPTPTRTRLERADGAED